MNPEQKTKFVQQVKELLKDYHAQVQSELRIFEGEWARGRVKYVSEWLSKVHLANLEHMLAKVPWDQLSESLNNDEIEVNGKTVTDWFNKLNQYLLRTAEALHFKSGQLAQNAKFLPNPFHNRLDTTYKDLYNRTRSLVHQLSEAGFTAVVQKTWYNEATILADTLVCAQVDAYGLASTQEGYSADAAEDLQQLAKRDHVPSVGVSNKTRQLTDNHRKQFLPASFTPMKSYLKQNQHTADGMNKMIEELALPQPTRK